MESGSPLTLTNSSFVGNSNAYAVFASNSSTIGNCTFSGNTGKGLYIYQSIATNCTVYNCTFTANTGDGIQLYQNSAANGTTSILSSTISGNSGYGLNNGEYNNLTLKNSIISGNTNTDYVAMYDHPPQVRSTNIIGTAAASVLTNIGRVTGSPLLGPLQNNGGTVMTMAVGAGSVAINAGTAAATNAAPINALDQRGYARSATTPTIGAVEYYLTPLPTITSITPATGTTAGGTAITITGTNFTPSPTLKIGGVAATNVTYVNATTITATTPAHAAGVDVQVNTTGGATVPNTLFTYIAGSTPTPAPTPTPTPSAPFTFVSRSGSDGDNSYSGSGANSANQMSGSLYSYGTPSTLVFTSALTGTINYYLQGYSMMGTSGVGLSLKVNGVVIKTTTSSMQETGTTPVTIGQNITLTFTGDSMSYNNYQLWMS